MAEREQKKLYETVVGAGIVACYLLVREVIESMNLKVDFGLPGQDTGEMTHVQMPLHPTEGSALGGVGNVELIRLTTDKTLLQIFVREKPTPFEFIVAKVKGEPTEDVERRLATVFQNAAKDVEAVRRHIVSRLQSLNLLA